KVRSCASMVINSYNDPMRSALSEKFSKIQRGHANLVSKKDIDVAVDKAKIGRTKEIGFDFDSYKEIATKHEKLRITSKHADEWEWWKRGSKSGIAMLIDQPGDSPRKLHFILDGMNMNGVVRKNAAEGGASITSSELRYLYRHWDELSGRVIF
ncbi:hypothetical protein C3E97_033195, partial [Pseudomonas sp. MWU12-2115]